MELSTHGVLEAWSLEDPDKARGRKYKRVIIDEAAMAKNLEYGWQNVITKCLIDYRGDARIKSTPKGMNFFWKMSQFPNYDDDWSLHHYTSYDNPFIDPEELDKQKKTDPEMVFKQEVMAEFLAGEGAVFRNINNCMHAPDTTPDAHKGHYIVAGVDWAKQADFTCISIGCVDCHKELARDRFNQIDYIFQRKRLEQLFKKWNVRQSLLELNSIGEPNFEELSRAGFPVAGFTTTASSKPPLIENLALTLEAEEWQFQQDPIWTGELEAYERKVQATTGRSQYNAPEGMHDDTVIARALMVWAARNTATVINDPFDE
jgi:hypothetical protein